MSDAGSAGPGHGLGCGLLIVDGLNTLGARPDGWWRDRPAAMARLVRRLGVLAEREQVPVMVVFDGRPEQAVERAAAEGVEVAFAPGGPDAADKVIAARVRESQQPEELLVVSSDRRLAAAVKAWGGRCVGAGGFAERWLRDSQRGRDEARDDRG